MLLPEADLCISPLNNNFIVIFIYLHTPMPGLRTWVLDLTLICAETGFDGSVTL